MNYLKDIPRRKLLEFLADLINTSGKYKLILDEAPSFKDYVLQQGYGPSRESLKVVVELKSFDQDQFYLLNSEIGRTTSFYSQRNPNRFIVIVPSILSPKVQDDYVSRVRNVRRATVEIWDQQKIEELIEQHTDVYERHFVNWNVCFEELTSGLSRFYKNHKEQSGRQFYENCIQNEDFKELNPWINKFSESYGVWSLDPSHVYFSINASKLSYEKRKNRLNLYLRLLGVNEIQKEIVFAGCPTPDVVKILIAREEAQQFAIWNFFSGLCEGGVRGLDNKNYTIFHDWYGINMSSFTMLLYYINSDNFLPLDENVRTLLVSRRVIESEPKSYNTYKGLIRKLEKTYQKYIADYRKDHLYGHKGLLRELTFVSYQFIAEKKNVVVYSKAIQEIIAENREVVKYSLPAEDYTQFEKANDESSIIQAEKENQVIESQSKEDSNLSTSFKIIAIRPHFKSKDKLLKVLKPEVENGTVYHFEQCFQVNNEIIQYFPEHDRRIYTDKEGKPINITAIVGKNGSGKSTLLELFFGIVNNIAFGFKDKLGAKNLRMLEGLYAELYYMQFGKIKKITVKEGTIYLESFVSGGKNKFKLHKKNSKTKFKYADLREFFYSVVVNYSIYGLNEIELGGWINGLFYKNDGYQTPIVINPMRKNGVIDINIENKLAFDRLVANLLEPANTDPEDSNHLLTEGKKASAIHLKLNKDKNKVLFYNKEGKEVSFDSLTEIHRQEIWDKIVAKFAVIETNISDPDILNLARNYLIRKVIRIALNYYEDKDWFNQELVHFNNDGLSKVLNEIYEYHSHITDKFYQTINYFKYPDVWPREKELGVLLGVENHEFENLIGKNIKPIELIPPPIYKYEIFVKELDNGNVSSMKFMSSGEKQIIYSTNSIVYHLRNLNSVIESKQKIHYNFINIILDEIELYYHPEMQQKYVLELLRAIKRVNLPEIDAINICLATHSPFILSDIPKDFVLRLEKGKPKDIENHETFGANIHDLLANDFFLSSGYIGEFSKKEINKVIQLMGKWKSLLEDDKPLEATDTEVAYVKQIIGLIGDELVKSKLLSMFGYIFPDQVDKQKQIDYYKEQIRKLEQQS